ncbi:Ntn hydrolase family protein [Halomicrococcus gelatinilyticus]|uniref:proteasome subunit beta n=1 Tax=Halomicrococcus gelatinilyticus TaxID=1702103 RepID=UPI002E12D59E
MSERDSVTKTGTTTVALTTDDAVVAAADRRASLGGRFVSNKDVQKIEQVHPTAVLTMAGTVGNLQAFVRTLRAETSLYGTRRDDTISMDALATLAGNALRQGPYRADQPTLAGVDGDGPAVYDLDAAGGVVEADYVANGSGMQVAYGVLEREQEAGMSLDAARRIAARAVDAASERDTASGNGVTLAEITGETVAFESYDDPAEVAEVAA